MPPHTQPAAFVIDFSVLISMLEGNNKDGSKDLLDTLVQLRESGDKKTAIMSTTPNLLYALYHAEKIDLAELKRILKTISLASAPSLIRTDMLPEEHVRNEIMALAKSLATPSNPGWSS
jgi:hypothetical protein